MTKYIINKRTCNIPDCDNKYYSSGLCQKHYNMARYDIHKDIRKHRNTNGFRYTPEYSSYMNMLQRCYNKNNILYEHYGGRGIIVCDRWRESFDNFIKDMGNKPPKTGIDRINNNGHYEPDNCQWITQSEQNKNRRPYSEWKHKTYH